MRWRRAALAAVVLPIIALLGFGMTRDPREIPSPLPGREAPDFALEVLPPVEDGRATVPDTVRLSAERGRIVVLNFWASWCLECRAEHQVLSDMAERYRERGVEFYGILYQDNPTAARNWIRAMGGQTYPTLLDPASRTAIDYGLYGVPETFFIGRDGHVATKHVGAATRLLLATRLDSLLEVDRGGDAPE